MREEPRQWLYYNGANILAIAAFALMRRGTEMFMKVERHDREKRHGLERLAHEHDGRLQFREHAQAHPGGQRAQDRLADRQHADQHEPHGDEGDPEEREARLHGRDITRSM